MYKILFFCLLIIAVRGAAKGQTEHPATVIITAGQSNTDGRVGNELLPQYIKQNKYRHCYWCYGSADSLHTDRFELFWPKTSFGRQPEMWAYDAVTYYLLEQSLQEDFYVIKWSLGGTAIDPACSSTGSKYWCACPEWLATNASTLAGGKSLLLSFTEQIGLCIDNQLCQLPQGYEIKAFLWHQGESDFTAGENYHDNLKLLVEHVRNYLVKKTGNEEYATLPFIFGTVAHANKCYNPEVESAMISLATEDPNSYLIDMSNAALQADELHFTAAAAEHLGIEIYKTLVELGVLYHSY